MDTLCVLISGGSNGIGRACAERFVKEGHTVYEISRRGRDDKGIRHLQADVTREPEVRAAVETMLKETGRIDVLLANAGFGISGAFEETPEEAYMKQFDVNVFGAVRLIQAVLPAMRAQGRGRILITSSLAGEIAIPFQSFYSATKASLVSFCLSLNNELRPFGIDCAALLPGDICTGFTDQREKTGSAVYKKLESSLARMEKDERGGASPAEVAARLYKMAVQKSRPRPVQTLGAGYHVLFALWRFLPRRFGNWLVGRLYA